MAKLGEVTCGCGLCPTCKNREYMRAYRKTESGSEASAKAQRAYYERNASTFRKKREEYRNANLETIREADRLYSRTKRRRTPPSPEKLKARNVRHLEREGDSTTVRKMRSFTDELPWLEGSPRAP